MFGRRITFMCRESVSGIHLVQLEHVGVASCFSEDRRGRDTRRKSIATNDAALRRLAMRNPARVDKNEVRRASQTLHRALHGQQSSVIDIDRVDLFDRSKSYGPADCILFDLHREFISFLRIEDLLRIVETTQLVILWQNASA